MASRLPELLAALLLLCSAAAIVSCEEISVTCPVVELDGNTKTYTLGRFDPSVAAAAAAAEDGPAAGTGACPDPEEVPAGSQVPFWLGTATAAYQIEGAATEGGRSDSIWDVFARSPGKTFEGDTGDVAVDFYHRYKEDVALMRSLGLRNFRFSLSWPRLLPSGTGRVNPEGVGFYSRLIDELKANCIEPHITLYHWDLPQVLYEQYGGWVDEQVVADFTAYAEVAFQLFGDRVKNWFTLNEPEVFCSLGYGTGVHAPGRCADRSRCAEGWAGEDLLCAYHAVLAHASAVKAFRKLVPDGKIAMTNAMGGSVPLHPDSTEDVAAAERNQAYDGAFVLDPAYRGDWPEERKLVHGGSLPTFTPAQKKLLLRNQQDFIALQHYTSRYVYNDPSKPPLNASSTTQGIDGAELPQADSPWLFVFPSGMRSVLSWLIKRYNQPILITENGASAPGEHTRPVEEVLCDRFRLSYFQQYIGNATAAVHEDGVNLLGYFAWSLHDNFEWADGYSKRFGVVYINYATLDRFYKASSLWLSNGFGLTNITCAPAGTSGGGSSSSRGGSGGPSSGAGRDIPPAWPGPRRAQDGGGSSSSSKPVRAAAAGGGVPKLAVEERRQQQQLVQQEAGKDEERAEL